MADILTERLNELQKAMKTLDEEIVALQNEEAKIEAHIARVIAPADLPVEALEHSLSSTRSRVCR